MKKWMRKFLSALTAVITMLGMIPDRDTRTREYEQGAIGYWFEGPSIALLYGADEEQTAVSIVKIGKMTSNVSVFETYRDAVHIELAESESVK